MMRYGEESSGIRSREKKKKAGIKHVLVRKREGLALKENGATLGFGGGTIRIGPERKT